MKRKFLYAGIVVMMLGLTGCSKTDAGENQTTVEEQTTEQSTSEETEEIATIGEEDALYLLDEKLADKNAKAKITDSVEIDSEPYYLASVTVDGEELFQVLALNGISGEIGVYNEDTDSIDDYSTFELYSKEVDEEIDWNGTFAQGDMQLTINAEEPGSFEAIFEQKGQEAVYVYASLNSNRSAAAEADGEKVEFVMKDNTLEVTSDKKDSVYAGTYESTEN